MEETLADIFEETQKELAEIDVSDDSVKKISELAKKQLSLLQVVDKAEDLLKEAKGKLDRVRNEDLPDAMMAAGVQEFKLDDGSKIKVSKIYAGYISEATRHDAFRWLRENQHGAIIKNKFEVKLGKGEDGLLEKLVNYCRENGFSFSNKESVHPQTLKAFLREQIEADPNFPKDLFGARIIQQSKITKGN